MSVALRRRRSGERKREQPPDEQPATTTPAEASRSGRRRFAGLYGIRTAELAHPRHVEVGPDEPGPGREGEDPGETRTTRSRPVRARRRRRPRRRGAGAAHVGRRRLSARRVERAKSARSGRGAVTPCDDVVAAPSSTSRGAARRAARLLTSPARPRLLGELLWVSGISRSRPGMRSADERRRTRCSTAM